MLTKIRKARKETVDVTSEDERVQVTVDSDADHPLTREEAHDALVRVEAATHEFLASVEADIEATAVGSES